MRKPLVTIIKVWWLKKKLKKVCIDLAVYDSGHNCGISLTNYLSDYRRKLTCKHNRILSNLQTLGEKIPHEWFQE